MINTHFCKKIIEHYKSATRIDVLHSPFVFDLFNACIKRTNSNTDFTLIESLRKKLKNDNRIITQNDFGANQSVRKKSVKYFAKQHAKPARIAQIIYQIIKHYQYKNIIELGTSLGLSGSYQAAALRKNFKTDEVHFSTIEGADEIAKVASENFSSLELEKYIHQYTGKFDDVLPGVLKKYDTIDMAFIDGNHRYEPTINYFKQFLPLVKNDSILIFDDIYWSQEMTNAWEEIKQNDKVTVTVDLFFLGLVFFRKEQTKEHFKLRIF